MANEKHLPVGNIHPQHGSWVTMASVLLKRPSISEFALKRAVSLGHLEGYFRTIEMPAARHQIPLCDLPKMRVVDYSAFFIRIPPEHIVSPEATLDHVEHMLKISGVEGALVSNKNTRRI